ncbi:reverse transcriptase [compost metagenome]
MRFADDLVIRCKTKEQALRAINVLKAVFGKLELTMNKEKSKLINLWGEARIRLSGDAPPEDTEEAERE